MAHPGPLDALTRVWGALKLTLRLPQSVSLYAPRCHDDSRVPSRGSSARRGLPARHRPAGLGVPHRRRRGLRHRRHLHPPGRLARRRLAGGLRGRMPAARLEVRPADRRRRRSAGQAAGPDPRGRRRGRHDLRPAVHGGAQPAALRRVPARRRSRVRTVAVVGASLAGLSAARSLRKQGYDGRLVVVGDETAPPVRQAAAVQGVPGRHARRGRSRAGDGRRGPAAPSGCSAPAPPASTARERAVRLADGTRGPRRRHRHRDRRRRADAARHRRPRRRAHPAHPGRRPRPARRTGPGRTAGGDRRRLHRRRGRLHRLRPRAST